MVTGDFDGDNHDEVILDYGEYGIHIWDSNGTPAWTQLHTLSPEDMVTGDFDGDNHDEVILDYGLSYGVYIWDSNGIPAWTQLSILSPDDMIMSDFDGDSLTYTWKFDGSVAAAATGNKLSVSDYQALAATGNHTVEVLISDGRNPATSHQWAFNIAQTNLPLNDTIDLIQGDSQNFSVGDYTGLTYVWEVDGVVVGTDSNSYDFAAGRSGQYKVRVTVNDGVNTRCHEWTVNAKSILDATVQRAAQYFWNEADPATGLVRDRVMADVPDPSIDINYNAASIAATGFGLAAMCVAAEKYGAGTDPDWQVAPADIADRVEDTLDTLLFIQNSQDPLGDSTWGKDGFFYHFVNINTGMRWSSCEVSSIDTAILVSGALTAGEYFGAARPSIRTKAQELYFNVKWSTFIDLTPGENYNRFFKQWMPDGGGYNNGHWDYNDESLLLYLLAIASPDTAHALSADQYYAPWRELGSYGANGKPLVKTWYGSLFAYQFPHAFFDLRDKHDARNVDWWQNTKDAVIANRQFCIDQDGAYGYDQTSWGLSSSYMVESVGYHGDYGALPLANPPGPSHDGTVNTSVVASSIGVLPLEAEQALTAWKGDANLWIDDEYGFLASFKNGAPRTYADFFVGIDLGAALAMLSNHIYSGIIWNSFMNAQTHYGTMNDLLTQLDFRSNTDPKHYLDIDDITAKSQFAYGFIDSTNTTAQISFGLTQVTADSKYLLAVHPFMNDSVADYDVQVNVNVNGADRGSQAFSHVQNVPDEVKYIEVDSSDLAIGENIITLTWTSGDSWLAWKNLEVSAPTLTNTWSITRSLYGNEYRLDDTYYAGHESIYGAIAYDTFEQALNVDTDPLTDIMFYIDDLSHGRKLTLEPYSADGTVYVDVIANGEIVADNLEMSSVQEVLIPTVNLRQGWNRIKLQIDNAGGDWIIWNTLVLDLGPSMLPPRELVAASFGKTVVNLRWKAVSGDDIRYNIYRSQTAGGPYAKLNSSDLTSPQYQDSTVSDSMKYYYTVTVFDLANPSEESGYSDEASVTTGNFEVDYGDGREPNVFGGVSTGPFVFMQGIRHDWTQGSIRELTLDPGQEGLIGLNSGDISQATILSMWIKCAGHEPIQIGLKGAVSGDASVNITTAEGWQNLKIKLSDFSGVSFNNMDRLSIKSLSAAPIVLYLDDIQFTTESLAGNSIDVVTKLIADNSISTGVDFANSGSSDYAAARQYLEVKYATSSNNWKIWIYTKNDNGVPEYMAGQYNGLMSSDGRNRVPLIWRVYPDVQAGGVPCGSESDVYSGGSMTWNFIKDKNDSDWTSANQPGSEYSVTAYGTSEWAHVAAVPPGLGDRDPIDSTFRIYLGGIFKDAAAAEYSAAIYFDLTNE
ncbi:MAG: glucoamylase family protein [Candidatus Omnitrophota bacterium]